MKKNRKKRTPDARIESYFSIFQCFVAKNLAGHEVHVLGYNFTTYVFFTSHVVQELTSILFFWSTVTHFCLAFSYHYNSLQIIPHLFLDRRSRPEGSVKKKSISTNHPPRFWKNRSKGREWFVENCSDLKCTLFICTHILLTAEILRSSAHCRQMFFFVALSSVGVSKFRGMNLKLFHLFFFRQVYLLTWNNTPFKKWKSPLIKGGYYYVLFLLCSST